LFATDPTATVIGLAVTLLPMVIGLVILYFVVRAAVAAGIARAAEQGHLPRGRE